MRQRGGFISFDVLDERCDGFNENDPRRQICLKT